MGNRDKNELSDRKKLILKAIVDAHIAGGEPVGSKYLLQNEQFTCSSATIRNEMAELEEMGYLEQPHTSAGRVPSELGYRFYVDALLQHYAVTAREVSQINNLLKAKMNELDRILETASKIASSMTDLTGFAVKPRSVSVRINRFEVIMIDETTLILVMVLSNDAVKTKNLHLDAPVDSDTVLKLNKVMNELLTGVCANEITLPIIMRFETEMGAASAVVAPIIKVIYEITSELDDGDLRVSGVNHLLKYPEYSDAEQFGELLSKFEEKEDILNLVTLDGNDDINVLIGSENSVKVMNNSTLVYKKIKKGGKTIGAIGVIGPLRMDYAKVLATLEELSGNIEILIDEKKLLNGGNESDGRKDE